MGAFQDGSARIQTQLLQIQPRSCPLMMSLKRLKFRHLDMRLLLQVVPISLTLPLISPCCDPGVLLVGILYIMTNLCIPTLHCQTPSLVCLSCSYGGSTLSLGVPHPPTPLSSGGQLVLSSINTGRRRRITAKHERSTA